MKAPARERRSRANQAFAAHAALLRTERADTSLRDNPFWTMLKQDAYERFDLAFAEARDV